MLGKTNVPLQLGDFQTYNALYGTPCSISPLLYSFLAEWGFDVTGVDFAPGRLHHLTDTMLDYLVDEVDGIDHVALVLFVIDEGGSAKVSAPAASAAPDAAEAASS